MKIIPTRAHAIKLSELLTHGLTYGLGQPEPGKMCVEAAVCFALGLPHGDDPGCVSKIVRSFKIVLNDSVWSSNQARAQGLRRLAIAQLGSDGIDDALFVKELALATVRKIVPLALRAAASVHSEEVHKTALESAASNCEATNDDLGAASAASAASAARYAASDAASAASAASAARYAASAASAASAARYAASAASDAASAARDAASAASAASAARYAASAARYAASDDVLSAMAEAAVGALIVCKSPGCEWLDSVNNL